MLNRNEQKSEKKTSLDDDEDDDDDIDLQLPDYEISNMLREASENNCTIESVKPVFNDKGEVDSFSSTSTATSSSKLEPDPAFSGVQHGDANNGPLLPATPENELNIDTIDKRKRHKKQDLNHYKSILSREPIEKLEKLQPEPDPFKAIRKKLQQNFSPSEQALLPSVLSPQIRSTNSSNVYDSTTPAPLINPINQQKEIHTHLSAPVPSGYEHSNNNEVSSYINLFSVCVLYDFN